MNKLKFGATLALLGAGAFASAFGASAAFADPIGSPTYRLLAGVGSDTTQGVMNALANTITYNGSKVIASYDATGSSTIATQSAAACQSIARPNGSGAGRTALLNSLTANSGAGDGCLQFSRSSSLKLDASTPSLTYIPFATDAVSYAVTNTSTISRNLTKADLIGYYTCDPAYVGTSTKPASDPTNTFTATPQLPQSGSGTRSFWESYVGITDANVVAGNYPCIVNGTKNGQIIEEHTGTALDDKSLAPFSIGQYNSQATQLIADRRGRAVLGVIDGSIPQLTNGTFANTRQVYNVIPTSDLTVSPWKDVFVGPTSSICSNLAILEQYGFAAANSCGDTSNHS